MLALYFKNFKNTIMKTNNIEESIGYVKAINDVIGIIKTMTESDPKKSNINAIELIGKILLGQQEMSMEAPPDSNEYYTMDKIDVKSPFKAIAGQDALFLNPVYDLNKNKHESQ